MTWEEALNAIAGAIDVSAYDEELNTLREAMSNNSVNTDLETELADVRAELAARETAYSDLQAKYRKRFGEMITENGRALEEKEDTMLESNKEDTPLTFADLSLTAETE